MFVRPQSHLVSSSALNAAVAALNAAATAMSVIGEHTENITSSDAAGAFTAAEEKMKQCFTAYNVSLVSLLPLVHLYPVLPDPSGNVR
jgi:hypothetical protein